jgi:heme/copper-type cytochrome/quinol oxidase subunit 4
MTGLERRLIIAWAVLVAVTLGSFAAAESRISHAGLAVAVVIVLAFVKVRIVILNFMEVGHAHWGLRLALEAWIVGLAGALIFLMV